MCYGYKIRGPKTHTWRAKNVISHIPYIPQAHLSQEQRTLLLLSPILVFRLDLVPFGSLIRPKR